MEEEGRVALLDCGQVKILNTSQRLGLAKLIVMVNFWEQLDLERQSCLEAGKDIVEITKAINKQTKILAETVKSFGVTFKEGAGDECAAAVAILLFGNTNTKLPGGFAGEEISKDSPIVQVLEFPAEFILLGRATVMIKGIANRLGIKWGLSDKWTVMAEETLKSSTTSASDVSPIWAVIRPNVLNSQGSMNSADFAGNKILRFADVKQSFINCIALFKTYLIKKGTNAIKKYIPQTILMKFIKYYSSIMLKLQK
jgi:aarF domain-containing kinase